MSISIPITPTVPVRLGRAAVNGAIVTVFGASGFVARHLVSRLGGTGAQVIVPYRSSDYDVKHQRVQGDLGQIFPIKVNTKDKDSLKRAMEHSNIVINLIGRNFRTKRFSIHESNVDTAAAIAQAAKELNVPRFLHFSAQGASPQAHSQFLRSKYESELVVRDALPNATIIRPNHVYGLKDAFTNKFGMISARLPFFPIPTNPGKIQPLFITDLVHAMMYLMDDTNHVGGKTYELGGPKVYTWEEFFELIKVATNRRTHRTRSIPSLLEPLLEFSNFQRSPILTRDMFVSMKDEIVVPHGAKLTIDKMFNIKKYPLTQLDEVLPFLISHWKATHDNYSDHIINKPGTTQEDQPY